MRYDWNQEIKNAAYIIPGAVCLAFGLVLFLAPNRIATGGTPGMAILLHHMLGLPIGMLMIAINVPLLAAGYGFLGKGFALRTIATIGLASLSVDLFVEILNLQVLSSHTMLASLYGGIAVGVGVGLILKGNASAGGSTIVARIVTARSHFRPGQVILFFDVVIIVSSALVFADVERALWSMISIYVTARCIDMLLMGTPSEKIVHIVSERVDLLSRLITERIGPHGTILSGSGLVRQQKKEMIFVIVEARRLTVLRDIIRKNDPEAFMVVMQAAEMLGRGH